MSAKKPFVWDIKALRRRPGRKLAINKQSKIRIYRSEKKTDSYSLETNGGRKRKHLSMSEKRTNSTKINNPRRNGQSPLSRKKKYIIARKVNNTIHRGRLAVNKESIGSKMVKYKGNYNQER